MCFGGQLDKVLYLCNREPQGRSARSPAIAGVLFHIHVRTLYVKAIFKGKTKKTVQGYEKKNCQASATAHREL